jgi:hypothetical protein
MGVGWRAHGDQSRCASRHPPEPALRRAEVRHLSGIPLPLNSVLMQRVDIRQTLQRPPARPYRADRLSLAYSGPRAHSSAVSMIG